MKNVKVWSDQIGRPSRLKELGLTEGILKLAVEQGQAAFANCTFNHPALFRGMVPWAEGMRSLRESLIPLGWNREDLANQPYAVTERQNLAITIASGDRRTGCKESEPSTKSAKGPITKLAVRNNELANTLFGDIRAAKDTRVTWILLFYRDDEASETRCELSLPLKMNKEGYVDQWVERIIMDPIPFGGSSSSVEISDNPPQSPHIEIEVRRKQRT
jgi:hypothetical protein